MSRCNTFPTNLSWRAKEEVIGLIDQELVFEHEYAGGMRHMR